MVWLLVSVPASSLRSVCSLRLSHTDFFPFLRCANLLEGCSVWEWAQVESSFQFLLFCAILLLLDIQQETFVKYLMNLTMKETKTERPNALLIHSYGPMRSTRMPGFLAESTFNRAPRLCFRIFPFSESRPALALLESFS